MPPVVIDVDGNPTEFPDEESATTFFKSRPAKPALPSNFAVSLPAAAPRKTDSRMERATDLAGQYEKKDLDALGKAVDIQAKINKDLPQEFINKMGAYNTTFELLKEIAKTKNKGFAGKPVDTGFFASKIPNNVSSWYSRNLEKMDPVSSSARRTLGQQIKAAVTPVKKDITGAASSDNEVREWIAPLMPSESDDDDPFNTSLIEAARQLATKARSDMNAQRSAGFEVPDSYDLEARLEELTGVVPKKYQIAAPKAVQ